MNGLDELIALEKKIAAAKERGERHTRNFWGFVAFFGFLCLSWFFFVSKVNPGLNNVPFYAICAFGIVAIIILVAGDVLFFNKTFAWQDEFDQKMATLTGQALGLDPKKVSLRHKYLLTFHNSFCTFTLIAKT